MQGLMGALAGGDAAWAAGYERREYNLDQSLPAIAGTRLSPTRTPSATGCAGNVVSGSLHSDEGPSDGSRRAAFDTVS